MDKGVTLPLEIFRTENSGWGLRCSCDIPIGSFICEYAGDIITDSEAVSRSLCHVSWDPLGCSFYLTSTQHPHGRHPGRIQGWCHQLFLTLFLPQSPDRKLQL